MAQSGFSKPHVIKIIIDKEKIYDVISRSANNPNLQFNVDNFVKSIMAEDLEENEQNDMVLSKSEDLGSGVEMVEVEQEKSKENDDDDDDPEKKSLDEIVNLSKVCIRVFQQVLVKSSN